MNRRITEAELRSLVREELTNTFPPASSSPNSDEDSGVRDRSATPKVLDLSEAVDDVMELTKQVVGLLKDEVYASEATWSKHQVENRISNAVMAALRQTVGHITRELEMDEEGNRW